jgi:hypothetical protein
MGCAGSKYTVDDSGTPEPTGFNINQLGTGDLVLFSDAELPKSKLKRALQNKWSHVAMIVHMPELYPGMGIMLLESSPCYSDGLVDVLSGHVRTSGVRLVDLRSRLLTVTEREIACRKWLSSSGRAERDERTSALNAFSAIVQNSGKSTERKAIQLAMSPIPERDAADEPIPAAGQLVAACLQRMHLLSARKPPSNYEAKTFTKTSLSTQQ